MRITTIYEGTSEIMEMTIARDRWQEHLKTRGQYYHAIAGDLESLAGAGTGADIAALAHHGLAEMMEVARANRLTRNQHVLFRLGELVAKVECAGALARRAAAALGGDLPEKADKRMTPEGLAASGRVFAREAASAVIADGMRWIVGAAPAGAIDVAALEAAAGAKAIEQAQAGLVADMDTVAEALYTQTTSA